MPKRLSSLKSSVVSVLYVREAIPDTQKSLSPGVASPQSYDDLPRMPRHMACTEHQIADYRTQTTPANLPLGTFPEIAPAKNTADYTETCSRDDSFVSENDLDAGVSHSETSIHLLLTLYHGGFDITTFPAPVGCISKVLVYKLSGQCFQRLEALYQGASFTDSGIPLHLSFQ